MGNRTLRIAAASVFICLAPALAIAAPGGGEAPRLAYLDPGAGSFLVQALVAMLAGIAVTLRVYWGKIKSLLGMSSEEDEKDENVRDSASVDE